MNDLAETSDCIHSLACFYLLSTAARQHTSRIFTNTGFRKQFHRVIFSSSYLSTYIPISILRPRLRSGLHHCLDEYSTALEVLVP